MFSQCTVTVKNDSGFDDRAIQVEGEDGFVTFADIDSKLHEWKSSGFDGLCGNLGVVSVHLGVSDATAANSRNEIWLNHGDDIGHGPIEQGSMDAFAKCKKRLSTCHVTWRPDERRPDGTSQVEFNVPASDDSTGVTFSDVVIAVQDREDYCPPGKPIRCDYYGDDYDIVGVDSLTLPSYHPPLHVKCAEMHHKSAQVDGDGKKLTLEYENDGDCLLVRQWIAGENVSVVHQHDGHRWYF